MADRALTYTLGKVHFAWQITSDQIEVYEMGVSGRPVRRIGMLTTETEMGTVPFEQEPFEEHCRWFAEMTSTAEIVIEDEDQHGDAG